MTVKLGVLDRLVLMSILPQEANFVTLKLIRGLKDLLGFKESELAALQFEEGTKGMVWKKAGDVPVEVEIGEAARAMILKQLQTLDAQNKLTMDHVGIYEMFSARVDP